MWLLSSASILQAVEEGSEALTRKTREQPTQKVSIHDNHTVSQKAPVIYIKQVPSLCLATVFWTIMHLISGFAA